MATTMQPSRPPANIMTPMIDPTPSTTTPGSQGLDLRHNDTQFHVIANLIVDKYQEALKTGATIILVTTQDKEQIDRMVSRDNFVDALRFRLPSCPDHSTNPIHVVTRQCKALGLHRDVRENLLYAAAGAQVVVNQLDDLPASGSNDGFGEDAPENMARQQLLTELKEASALMAESVTADAAQFWKKHVVDLQARLRALHEKEVLAGGAAGDSMTRDAEEIMRKNEKLLKNLQENTGYVSVEDEHRPTTSPASPYSGYTQMDDQPQYQPRSMTQSGDPHLQGLPMVDVVAPADLSGGYTFEAEIEDRRFLATVPAGGVRKGQTFSCYMRDLDTAGSDTPVGRWRDSLFDVFKHGPLHPMALNSFLCPTIALSQIMTRMGFDFLGRPSNDVPRHGMWSTRGMMNIVIGFWAVLNSIVLIGFAVKASAGVVLSGADITAFFLVNVVMVSYVIYATMNTRSNLRERYMIREDDKFAKREDMFLSVACLPCTLAQMGRHTASYDTHTGICCSDTGIPVEISSNEKDGPSVYGV